MPQTPPDRESLASWLTDTQISGAVPTDRASNLNNLRGLAGRDPLYMFGVEDRKSTRLNSSHWE